MNATTVSVAEYDAHAQKLVLRRRGYEAKILTTPPGQERDIQQGIIDGLQIAIDILRGDGVEIVDPPPKRTRKRQKTDGESGELGAMARALLSVLVAREKPTSKELLGVLSVYAPSGPMNTAMKDLRDAELIDGAAHGIVATQRGRDEAKSVVKPLHGDALLAAWVNKLSVQEAELLQSIVTIARKRAGAISNDEIQSESGYRPSGPYNTAMKRLRDTHLIEPGTNRPVEELIR